eukprot:CAMPEP_0115832548 /NCGR_PEP_ID=MMETSP0287-20121206/2716_1 /TAXON_ID=412157 /ORGANISM="Chrysochromulina rotalis, Strain UIO044" /LENGTH=86 /DNA_ID=CAMNT_0003285939 /DNA_START=359 /DNA_END=619 /DNA_ORIENTATION=-
MIFAVATEESSTPPASAERQLMPAVSFAAVDTATSTGSTAPSRPSQVFALVYSVVPPAGCMHAAAENSVPESADAITRDAVALGSM